MVESAVCIGDGSPNKTRRLNDFSQLIRLGLHGRTNDPLLDGRCEADQMAVRLVGVEDRRVRNEDQLRAL